MTQHNVRLIRCDAAADLERELGSVGADQRGVRKMVSKGCLRLLRLEDVSVADAHILKGSLLSCGGDAALSADAYYGRGHLATDMVIMATDVALGVVIDSLSVQPPQSLRVLARQIAAAVDAADRGQHAVCRIGTEEFRWGTRTHVMGILNVTPDSFSGDGVLSGALSAGLVDAAVGQALEMLDDGADIIDVGGESTRPGSTPVSAQAEMDRVVPVIRDLRRRTSAPLSVDTDKASVAEAALDAGADMVNDVWGLRLDEDMGPLVAASGVPVVIMHNRSKPKDAAQEERLGGHYIGVQYDDLLGDIIRELRSQVAHAMAAGIQRDRIIIDPGIGFGKTVQQNLRLLNHVDELRVLGLPILLGPSRKSFIGYTLDLPPEERVEGTAAAVAVGILRGGADIVRVHDVKAIARVARMVDATMAAE